MCRCCWLRAWCTNLFLRELFPNLQDALLELDEHASRIETGLKDAVAATILEKKEKIFQRKMLEEEIQMLRESIEKAQEEEAERVKALSMHSQEIATLAIAQETTQAKLMDLESQLSA